MYLIFPITDILILDQVGGGLPLQLPPPAGGEQVALARNYEQQEFARIGKTINAGPWGVKYNNDKHYKAIFNILLEIEKTYTEIKSTVNKIYLKNIK